MSKERNAESYQTESPFKQAAEVVPPAHLSSLVRPSAALSFHLPPGRTVVLHTTMLRNPRTTQARTLHFDRNNSGRSLIVEPLGPRQPSMKFN